MTNVKTQHQYRYFLLLSHLLSSYRGGGGVSHIDRVYVCAYLLFGMLCVEFWDINRWVSPQLKVPNCHKLDMIYFEENVIQNSQIGCLFKEIEIVY